MSRGKKKDLHSSTVCAFVRIRSETESMRIYESEGEVPFAGSLQIYTHFLFFGRDLESEMVCFGDVPRPALLLLESSIRERHAGSCVHDFLFTELLPRKK